MVVLESDTRDAIHGPHKPCFGGAQGRAKPYLPQICGTIKWRLNNKSAKIRQQAADLIARIALVMKVRIADPLSPALSRAQLVGIVRPHGFTSGLAAMASTSKSCTHSKSALVFGAKWLI